jgi:riboflavin synthase
MMEGKIGLDGDRNPRRTNLGPLSDWGSCSPDARFCGREIGSTGICAGHVDGSAAADRSADGAGIADCGSRIRPALAKYIIPKGSVSIDGVSLTIAAIDADFLRWP